MKAKLGSGVVVLWGPGRFPVAMHALWFGAAKLTVHCMEMAAFVCELELIVKWREIGKSVGVGRFPV